MLARRRCYVLGVAVYFVLLIITAASNVGFLSPVLSLPNERFHLATEPAGVLFMVPWLKTGGSEAIVYALHRYTHEFTSMNSNIVVTDRAVCPDTAFDSNAVTCLPKFLAAHERLDAVNQLISQNNVHTLILSHSEIGYAMLPALRLLHPKLRCIDVVHIVERNYMSGWFPRVSLLYQHHLDATIAVSDHLRNWMVEQGAPPSNRIFSLPLYRMVARDACIQGALIVENKDPHRLVFVGRLAPQKRPHLLWHIMEALGASYELYVVGDGPERLKPHTHIHQVGAKSPADVMYAFERASILLLPSDNEGLALVAAEAMALKTIPIVADVGAMRELVAAEYLVPHHSNFATPQQEARSYAEIVQRVVQVATTDLRQSMHERVCSEDQLHLVQERVNQVLFGQTTQRPPVDPLQYAILFYALGVEAARMRT